MLCQTGAQALGENRQIVALGVEILDGHFERVSRTKWCLNSAYEISKLIL
jgi:hypothetical protein